ncbi:MFS transporter [uncultured Curtobacterium sp.]|uniref:MFS transporter n=1 Tax=uncultured Curtobacterium sp. TaxID=331964 RepID=UPI0025843439|nr:MFS transporter [uncultured Curtobacterium sp.]
MTTTTTREPEGLQLSSGTFPAIGAKETKRGATLAFFAWTLAVYDFIMFGTLLPRIAQDFGWNEQTALLANTLVSVGVFVVVILVGLFVDRLGRRRGMMVTIGGAALSSLLTAASTGVASLVGFRALSGFGMAEQSVNSTYLNEVFALTELEGVKKRRGFFYSLVQTGWPIGALFAAAFIAGVAGVFGQDSWRLAFLIATVPAIFVLFLRKGIKETPQHRLNTYLRQLRKSGRTEDAAEIAARFGIVDEGPNPLRAIFGRRYARNTVVLSIAWIVNYFGITTTSVLGTTMLEGVKGVDPSMSLLIIVLSNVVGAAGYLFHGWLGDVIGRKTTIVAGWMLAGVCWTLFVTGPSDFGYVLVTYMATLFFLLGPYASLLFLQAECFDSSCRATGSAFVTAMGQPGSIIGSAVLTVLVAGSIGLGPAALIVGAGGMVLSGVIMLATKRVAVIEH